MPSADSARVTFLPGGSLAAPRLPRYVSGGPGHELAPSPWRGRRGGQGGGGRLAGGGGGPPGPGAPGQGEGPIPGGPSGGRVRAAVAADGRPGSGRARGFA